MSILGDLFADVGLGRVAYRLEAGAKDSVRLSASNYSEAATTRLGGRPNLPPGIEWPVLDGCPLAFVAQMELGEISPIIGLDLPRSGSLYFFYGSESAGEGEAFRVLSSERALASLPLSDVPQDLPDDYRWKGVQLEVLRNELTFPGTEDPFFAQLGLSAEELDRYTGFKEAWDSSLPPPPKRLPGYPRWLASMPNLEALRERWDQERPYGIHRIGGYPDYIQHDPKFVAHLLASGAYSAVYATDADVGFEADENASRFEKARERFGPGAMEWEVLLQLDSEESAEIVWGDVGRLHFLIHRDDLRRRRFEKTQMIFECH